MDIFSNNIDTNHTDIANDRGFKRMHYRATTIRQAFEIRGIADAIDFGFWVRARGTFGGRERRGRMTKFCRDRPR